MIAGSRRGRTDHPTHAALVVEVAESTFFYDTTTKAELYATAKIPEYWVLDLNARNFTFSAVRNRFQCQRNWPRPRIRFTTSSASTIVFRHSPHRTPQFA